MICYNNKCLYHISGVCIKPVDEIVIDIDGQCIFGKDLLEYSDNYLNYCLEEYEE